LGARTSHAVALAETGDAAGAMAVLDCLRPEAVAAYAPYWVARAHVLRLAQAPGRAEALQRAIGLTDDPRLRDFLATQGG
jgi:RNA polymerase sigma-70 factor (ECF subfamily)